MDNSAVVKSRPLKSCAGEAAGKPGETLRKPRGECGFPTPHPGVRDALWMGALPLRGKFFGQGFSYGAE
jgi:hypothetical protein